VISLFSFKNYYILRDKYVIILFEEVVLMKSVHIGYVKGVHGLRGDLKIKCQFESPDKVFKNGNKIYLNEEEHTITNSKLYKGLYLVTIDNLKDINLVEHYIGYDVYFDREDLNLGENDYILSDLYGMEIVEDGKTYGKVLEILENTVQKILVIDYEPKYMVPLVDEYVKKVDLENKVIEVEDVRSLII